MLTLIAGLLFGISLTVAEAAHRAGTVVDRYDAATQIEDAEVPWISFEPGPRIDLDAAGRLPEVEAAGRALAVVPFGLVSDAGVVAHVGDFEFDVPIDPDFTRTVDRPLLLAGRLPSPRRPDEVVVDQVMAASLRLHVGSRLRVRLLTPAEGRDLIAGRANWIELADPRRQGTGPLVRLHVVGVEAWREDADLRGELIASPAFARTYRRLLGAPTSSYLAVRLHRPGDFSAFAADVAKLYPKGAPVYADASAPFGSAVVAVIDLQSTTAWLLAAAAAVVAFVGIAPALARRTARASAEQDVLRAIGLPQRRLMLSAMAGPVAVALGAGTIAVIMGALASPLTAFGVSRMFDPTSGMRVDWTVLLIGAAAVALALSLVGALATRYVTVWATRENEPSDHQRRRFGLPPSTIGAVPVPVALGIANAFGGGSGRLRVSTVSTIAAITAMIAVVAASLVVATSATRLLDSPRLYGQSYGLVGSVGGQASAALNRAVQGVKRDSRAVAATSAGIAAATIDGRSIDLLGTMPIKKSVPLSLISGRAPLDSREIALGRGTLAALHLDLGDVIRVHGSRRTLVMRVVGTVVLPYVLWEAQGVQLGDGGVVTLGALRSLDPGTSVSRILVRTAHDVDTDQEVTALTSATATEWDAATTPPEVGEVTHVLSVPYLLVALIAAAATAALAHVLIATTRRRRREIAILKTLGISRRAIAASVFVQSATTSGTGCLLGLPLGLILGLWTWNTVADRMGVVAQPVLPPASALLVPAAFALCVFVAVVPALLAVRVPAADVLRAE